MLVIFYGIRENFKNDMIVYALVFVIEIVKLLVTFLINITQFNVFKF